MRKQLKCSQMLVRRSLFNYENKIMFAFIFVLLGELYFIHACRRLAYTNHSNMQDSVLGYLIQKYKYKCYTHAQSANNYGSCSDFVHVTTIETLALFQLCHIVSRTIRTKYY